MNRVANLWSLQTLDHEHDDKRHRLDQIALTLASDAKLAAVQTARDSQQTHLALLHGKMQDAELHAKSLDAKIKELESKMSSGRVTNPKELDSLEKDRQMHLRHRGELDTQILEMMDALERAQKESKARDATLKKTQAASANDAQKLGHESDTLTARLAELDAAVAKLRAMLDADALSTYDRIRQSKAGRALSRLKQGACGICGVQIPSGLVARVDEGEELIFCPGCGRILVA